MTTAANETEMTLVQAVTDALACEMRLDDRVIILGEDVGLNGGVFRATEGLQAERLHCSKVAFQRAGAQRSGPELYASRELSHRRLLQAQNFLHSSARNPELCGRCSPNGSAVQTSCLPFTAVRSHCGCWLQFAR